VSRRAGSRSDRSHSFDGGRTWEEEPKRLPVPFTGDATDGPIVELKDGSALICVYGKAVGAHHEMVAFCRRRRCMVIARLWN
jgi:hypothetical protein